MFSWYTNFQVAWLDDFISIKIFPIKVNGAKLQMIHSNSYSCQHLINFVRKWRLKKSESFDDLDERCIFLRCSTGLLLLFSWSPFRGMWLLLPLHHVCGFLSCYGVRDVCWCFNGRFNYYLNHLAPLCAGPKALKSGPVSPGCGRWGPKAYLLAALVSSALRS